MSPPTSRAARPRARSRALLVTITVVTISGLAAAGCASKAYVRRQMDPEAGPEKGRLAELDERLEESSERLAEVERRVAENRELLEETSQSARLALERAQEIEREAATPPQVVLRHDSIPFAPGSAELEREARDLLDAFARQLLARRQPVHIEIRGHSDSAEPGGRDMRLAGERAGRVERYLHDQHGIPLHRMDTLALGSRPDPDQPAGGTPPRHHRRVSLIVVW